MIGKGFFYNNDHPEGRQETFRVPLDLGAFLVLTSQKSLVVPRVKVELLLPARLMMPRKWQGRQL